MTEIRHPKLLFIASPIFIPWGRFKKGHSSSIPWFLCWCPPLIWGLVWWAEPAGLWNLGSPACSCLHCVWPPSYWFLILLWRVFPPSPASQTPCSMGGLLNEEQVLWLLLIFCLLGLGQSANWIHPLAVLWMLCSLTMGFVFFMIPGFTCSTVGSGSHFFSSSRTALVVFFFEILLLFPSLSPTNTPTDTLVTELLMWGGPLSRATCSRGKDWKFTGKFCLSAISNIYFRFIEIFFLCFSSIHLQLLGVWGWGSFCRILKTFATVSCFVACLVFPIKLLSSHRRFDKVKIVLEMGKSTWGDKHFLSCCNCRWTASKSKGWQAYPLAFPRVSCTVHSALQ